MALAEELTKWSGVRQDLAQKRAMRPYIGELAEIGRDFERSRAEQQKASAGLAGLQLQFEPQRQQQVTEQGRLVNLLNQMKIKQMQTQMAAPPPPLSNATEFGRHLIEQQEIEQQFGPESPQAQYYQQFIESKLPGAVGAQMLTPFEGPSGVPLEIVQTGEKDKTLRKDPVTNIFYKPVTDKRFNDNIEKIGVIGSVVNDLDDLKKVAPIFQTGWKGNWRDAQVLISNYTGTRFSGTDKKAAGDAILATIKDKIMKLEGFPSLTQAYADAEKIVKIGKGESVPNYQERIGRLITKFEEEQKHLQDENQFGADITSRKPKEEKPKAGDNWVINPQTGRPVLR